MQSPQDKSFRLYAALTKQPGVIRHDAPSLLIGSCFATEVGRLLKQKGFPVAVNPFGTLFNPLGIFELLANPSSDYFEGLNVQRDISGDGHWVNYRLHSKVIGDTEAELNQNIKAKVEAVNRLLPACGLLVLTLGTAWVWSFKGDGRALANLHKQPQGLFERRLLGVEEVAVGFSAWYEEFRKINPVCRVLLTVSPVIHGKAELHENILSKSVLLLAANQIVQKHTEVGYFPSYEIVRDELRDYRYYADDMQHPSAAAVEYVTDCFLASYADNSTLKLAEETEREYQQAAHRKGGTGLAGEIDWAEVWQRNGVAEKVVGLLRAL